MPPNEEVWAALAAEAAQQIDVMTAAYSQARMTSDAFIERSARALAVAAYSAAKYADLAASAWALSVSGLPSNVLGLLPPPDEQERLIKAMATIHADTLARERVEQADVKEASRRIRRLVDGNTKNHGLRTYQRALRERGVESWTRILSANPCEGCLALKADEGDAVPMDVEIFEHVGCHCRFVPSDRAERTWGERVKADSFGVRSVLPSGATFSSGLVFTNID